MAEVLGRLSPDRAASQSDIRDLIDRVVIGRATIRIQLSEVAEGTDSARVLTLPWTPPSPYRKREIIQGANDAKTYAHPMPANARAILIEALRDAHRWRDVLLSDPRLTLESIASREGKSERSIRMTLSLAFLAPEIVKAAVEGRQGHVQRQIVVEVETSDNSQATFRLRIDASNIVALRQNGHFPSPDSPSLGP